jgi:hypothetical protein
MKIMGGGVLADLAFLRSDIPNRSIATIIDWALVY